MPFTSFDWNLVTNPCTLKVAMLRRSSSASVGVNPAATIAIFIACMGLFGLVSYVALRRTREISIRKVLGATQSDVVGVLSSDFFRLLAISAVLAIGFGIWFSDAWLAAFANRATVGLWPYLSAILVVLLLALVTIGYRSWKVFTLNPSKTLKSD